MPDQPKFDRRRALLGAVGLAALGAAVPASRAETPRQTEGPFFPDHDPGERDADMTRLAGRSAAAKGEVVDVHGTVRDETGQPVAGALVDVWQANAAGRYAHGADPNPAPLDPDFQGWAQLTTDAEGRFRFRTIKPGPYPVREGWSRPPHIHFKVARRGYHELTTQMYFAGEPLNEVDRLLGAVPAARRGELIVAFAPDGAEGVPLGRFDIEMKQV